MPLKFMAAGDDFYGCRVGAAEGVLHVEVQVGRLFGVGRHCDGQTAEEDEDGEFG